MHYDFAELLVAYDFSEAADSSLKYEVLLAKRCGSFIHLVGVRSPAEYSLLLGAFGYGPIDRPRLGSTAEHLLRTVRCPVFVVGPHATLRDREAPSIQRTLCATTSLETPDDIVCFAGHFAAKMGAKLDIVHAVDATQKDASYKHHKGCLHAKDAYYKLSSCV
jgi:hypothetical protein